MSERPSSRHIATSVNRVANAFQRVVGLLMADNGSWRVSAHPEPRTTSEMLLLRAVMYEAARDPAAATNAGREADDVTTALLGNKAMSFLDEHYMEHMTVRIVSRHFRVTKQRLDAALKRQTGMTVHEYVRHKRVTEALAMVQNGTKVEAAALAVGYRCKGTLYAAVRQLTGSTPLKVARNV